MIRKRFGLDPCNTSQPANLGQEEKNCAKVWYDSVNLAELPEGGMNQSAMEANAARQQQKHTLLAQGTDFSLPFEEFFASLPSEIRAQRRAAHLKAVDGIHCWTTQQLDAFLSLCREKFKRAEIEPGNLPFPLVGA